MFYLKNIKNRCKLYISYTPFTPDLHFTPSSPKNKNPSTLTNMKKWSKLGTGMCCGAHMRKSA